MLSLENFSCSSGVNVLGSVLVIPSFSSLLNCMLLNVLTPFLDGTSLLYNALVSWVFSWNILASNCAARRLLAADTACMSPVKCRLKSSIGITWEYPPPAAPPLIPKVGPWEGCRKVAKAFRFLWAVNAWTKPTRVVLFPSPNGVGVILKIQSCKIENIRYGFVLTLQQLRIFHFSLILICSRRKGIFLLSLFHIGKLHWGKGLFLGLTEKYSLVLEL